MNTVRLVTGELKIDDRTIVYVDEHMMFFKQTSNNPPNHSNRVTISREQFNALNHAYAYHFENTHHID